MTTLYLGADHAGWKLKEALKPALQRMDVVVRDLSPTFNAGDDYPKVAMAAAKSVARNKALRGVLFCGSGVGMAIAANRMKGVRAMDAASIPQVKLARAHDDVNVLTVGALSVSPSEALRLINAFLAAPASKAARHRRRVKQLG